MNCLSLPNTTLRHCKLGLTSGSHQVKPSDRAVSCNVLTVVDASTSATNPSARPIHSPSKANISEYIWSFVGSYVNPSGRTNGILNQRQLSDAAAAAANVAKKISQVSTHVKAATKLEVKSARLMSDLSNMAYDVTKVTPTALLQRHKLHLVEASEVPPPPAKPTTRSPTLRSPPSTKPHSQFQSNIVPFPRSSSPTHISPPPSIPTQDLTQDLANQVLQATVETYQATESTHQNPQPIAHEDGPLQWFISDTTTQPEPLRIFAIQGSVTFEHWKINLAFDPVPFETPDLGVHVHRGVYQAALELYPVFYPYVVEHLASHPSAQITFTGHSLGGSVSTILMLLFVARGVLPPSAVFPIHTFGAPAVLCDGATPGVTNCSSCQLSCNSRNKKKDAQHTWSSCAGLLVTLGLPSTAVRNVVMHQDIVPRAFMCDYSQVAQLLQQWGPAFKAHVGLSSSQSHKVLYNFLGTVHILQPDRRHKFCLSDQYHPLLPAYPALYTVHGEDGCGDCNAHQAVLEFMNSPHPLQVLGSRAAYGETGSISRYHNPDNYTKALFGLLKRW